MNTLAGVAGSIVTLVGTLVGLVVTGWLSLRASRAAAAITAAAQQSVATTQAAPQAKQVDLDVLVKTTERVDRENNENRTRISRLESLVRAFAWTADRWAGQMRRAGIDPDPEHPLVTEYNRTGV